MDQLQPLTTRSEYLHENSWIVFWTKYFSLWNIKLGNMILSSWRHRIDCTSRSVNWLNAKMPQYISLQKRNQLKSWKSLLPKEKEKLHFALTKIKPKVGVSHRQLKHHFDCSNTILTFSLSSSQDKKFGRKERKGKGKERKVWHRRR